MLLKSCFVQIAKSKNSIKNTTFILQTLSKNNVLTENCVCNSQI